MWTNIIRDGSILYLQKLAIFNHDLNSIEEDLTSKNTLFTWNTSGTGYITQT